MYTGYQTIKHETRKPLPILLKYLDDATAQLGLTINLPEVDKARDYQARAHELRTTYTKWTDGARDRADDAARKYASGDLTAAEVLAEVEASAATGEISQSARTMIEAGARGVEAVGTPLLYSVTEAKWLKIIRPVIDAAIKHAQTVADELGIEGPRPQRVGVRSATHPWAPTEVDLRDINTRHRWERLEDALDQLDAAYGFADTLRDWGLIPAVEGRTIREDYRWLHIDRLNGNPAHGRREFWLINRHEGEPGIYTAAELTKADQAARTPKLAPAPTEADISAAMAQVG